MSRERSFIHSFNVIRAGAVLAVIAYHVFPDAVPFGYLGVVMFFALAGYLSMRQVVQRSENPLKPSVLSRLIDKLFKLYVPLAILLLVVSLMMVKFFPTFLDKHGKLVQSSILGYNNIQQILAGESYFEGQGYVKPLTHIWALSLELQFYVGFILLVESTYRKRYRMFWAGIMLVVAITSVAIMYAVFTPGEPTRMYYGTDSRLYTFALGALTALLPKLPIPDASKGLRRGLAGLVILLVLGAWALYVIPVPVPMTTLLLGYTILSVLLIYILADDQVGFIARLGQWAPIRWICTRSYELYLWHYPIAVMVPRLALNAKLPPIAIYAIILGLTGVISEIGYRVARLIISRKRKAIVDGEVTVQQRRWDRKWLALPVLATGLAALYLFPWQKTYEAKGGLEFREMEDDFKENEAQIESEREAMIAKLKEAQAATTTENVTEPEASDPVSSVPSLDETDPIEPSESRDASAPSLKEEETSASAEPSEVTPDTAVDGASDTSTAEPSSEPTEIPDIEPASDPVLTEDGQAIISIPETPLVPGNWYLDNMKAYFDDVTAYGDAFALDMDELLKYRNVYMSLIGDSVSVIANPHMPGYLPSMIVDAKSSRRHEDLWSIYEGNKAAGLIGDMLVITLGNNGNIAVDQLEQVHADLGGKPMILMTIITPQTGMMNRNNENIRNFAAQYDDVHVVEWAEAAIGHAEFFQEDQIHPTTIGSKAYSHLIAMKVVEILKQYEAEGRLRFEGAGEQG